MAYPGESPTRNPEAPAEDNWRHRTTRMLCAGCMWFVNKPRDTVRASHQTATLGRCRRHSPTLAGFPAVFESDWCGDHKLDENMV